MSGVEKLPEVKLPDWVDLPLTGAGAPDDTRFLADTAKGTDIVGGAFEMLFSVELPSMNPAGAAATAVAQYQQSIAQHWAIRMADAAAAGVFDLVIGGAKAPWGPLVPIVDALVVAPLSREFGADLSAAGNFNGAVHALAGLADAHYAGEEESGVRTRARSEIGDLGVLPRLVAAALARFRRWKAGG